MTPFYITGIVFFVWALAISILGFKSPSFPGKSIAPVVGITALLFAATVGTVIKGGQDEVDHRKKLGEKAEPYTTDVERDID